MTLTPGQSGPDQAGMHRAGDLRSANGPGSLDRAAQWRERASAIHTKVWEELKERSGIPGAQSISPHDLLLAAFNGMSPETTFSIPAPPGQAKNCPHPTIRAGLRAHAIDPEALVVTYDEGQSFFQHVLWGVRHSGRHQPEVIKRLEQEGLALVGAESYLEYVDVLQGAARYLRKESGRLAPELAEYSALLALCELEKGKMPSASLPQIITIGGTYPGGLALNVGSLQMNQSLKDGARVFLAGAGYNALRDLSAMRAASQFEFVLNDSEPFVAAVLEHAVASVGAANITSAPGSMSAVLGKLPSFDLIIVSNAPSATPHEVAAFASAAARNVPPKSPIHVCQVEIPAADHLVPASAWSQSLEANGFAKLYEHLFPGQATTVDSARRMALIDKPAVELLDLLKNPNSLREPRLFRYFVGRLMDASARSQN